MRLPISLSVTLVLFCTVSEILQVFVLMTSPYSTLILGMFPLDQIARVGNSPCIYLILFIDREWSSVTISRRSRFSCQLFYSEHSTFKAHHNKMPCCCREDSAMLL